MSNLPKATDAETIAANERLREHQKKQETKVYTGENGQKIAVNQGFTRKATVYFKANDNCEFNVDTACTKILIEGCNNSIIRLNARINTEVVEIWNCENTTLEINTKVKTLQADLSTNLTVKYAQKSFFSQIIWAGITAFNVTIGETVLETGIEKVNREEIPDFKERFDQFIVRFVKGKLLEELIVRLKNGFPTTEREADAFDEQKEKNDKLYEAHVRRLIGSRAVGDKLEGLTKTEIKKVGRNDPCPCESGKKYKKCCEGKSILETDEAKKQIAEAKEEIQRSEAADQEKSDAVQKLAAGISLDEKKE